MDTPTIPNPPGPGDRPERWLVPVDGSRACAGLIREAARLARERGVPWLAAHLERTNRFRYSRAEQERLAEHLRLAERLGAEVVQLRPSGLRSATDFLALARARKVTAILVGRTSRPWWPGHTFLQDLVRWGKGIEIRVLAPAEPEPAPRPAAALLDVPEQRRFGTVLLTVVLATLAGLAIHRFFDLADLVMLYMLCIAVVAARFGRGSALLATGLSIAALDFFFVPPRFTLAVRDLRHLGTFTIMLGVGWMVATLAEQIRAQARMAQERERHTGALFRMGSVLAEGGSVDAILARVEAYLADELGAPALLLLADPRGQLEPRSLPGIQLNADELAVAQWALKQGEATGRGTPNLPGARALFLPLPRTEHPVGVLAWFGEALASDSERRGLLEALAAQISLALERARLAEERAEARLEARHEHLRSTLLGTLSHDLRTPLGTITGATSTLLEPGPEASPEDQRLLLLTIHQEAGRLQKLVNNLLDLTRLESGQVRVAKEWIPVEEVVGSVLSRMEDQLADRPLELRLPEAWIPLDPVLFEQVLVNLLDNALKFSPPGTPLEIACRMAPAKAVLTVTDQGPGIPAGEEERIFDKLFRGTRTASTPGAGLGLAICRGIIQAHGGTIRAETLPGRGTRFLIELPVEGQPPDFDREAP
jgi:two-component system sensor histidine kinase KdpD